MAITVAAKFEYVIPDQAEAMKIPTNVLKVIIRRLFGMATFGNIPDTISFIEQVKAYPVTLDADGVALYKPQLQRLLLNGEDTLIIGLQPGEGTDLATVQSFIDKASSQVTDLSPWRT